MRIRLTLLIVVCFVMGAWPAAAQRNSTVITPDNAALLSQVGMLGRGYFNDLEWSPDGQTLAVSSSVGVWLYGPTQSTPRLVDGYGGTVDVAYSADGSLMTIAQSERSLVLDTATWTPTQTLEGSARAIAISPDGAYVATAGFAQVQLWDTATGDVVRTWPHEDILNCLAFDPSGRYVAGGNGHPKMTPQLYVWDVETGDMVENLEMLVPVYRVAFSPDASRLAVIGEYETTQVWDFKAEQWQELDTGGTVRDVIFSDEGDALFVTVESGEVQVWDTATYEKTILLDAAEAQSRLQALNLDKQTLAVADQGSVFMFDVDSGDMLAAFPGGTVQDSEILFSPDSTLLASGNLNGPLDLWDVAAETVRESWDVTGMMSLAFSPDGAQLVIVKVSSKSVVVWTLETDDSVSFLSDAGIKLGRPVFNPDGTRMAMTAYPQSGERGVLVLDSLTGDILENVVPPDGYSPFLVNRYTDDTVEVLLRNNAGYVLFDVSNDELVPLPEGISTPLQFSPDRRLLAAENEADQIEIWDTSTWESRWQLDVGSSVTIAFSPDSALLAVGDRHDGTLDVWDVQTGDRLFHHMQIYAVQRLEFSPDGTLLAVAGNDNVVRLWGIPRGS